MLGRGPLAQRVNHLQGDMRRLPSVTTQQVFSPLRVVVFGKESGNPDRLIDLLDDFHRLIGESELASCRDVQLLRVAITDNVDEH